MFCRLPTRVATLPRLALIAKAIAMSPFGGGLHTILTGTPRDARCVFTSPTVYSPK
jgi:hypothetical protein